MRWLLPHPTIASDPSVSDLAGDIIGIATAPVPCQASVVVLAAAAGPQVSDPDLSEVLKMKTDDRCMLSAAVDLERSRIVSHALRAGSFLSSPSAPTP